MTVEIKPVGRMAKLLLKIYDTVFGLVLPLLQKNRRLQAGWEQRMVKNLPPPCDLWLQAASGGEAYLVLEILYQLPSPGLRIMITTNTVQGRDILQQGLADWPLVQVSFCPFDKPSLMRAFSEALQPRLIVLLETELWPGLLGAAKRQKIPVLLANGRISSKSLKSYLRVKGLFRALAPDSIMAISAEDAARFWTLFKISGISIMPNIKFDRIQAAVNEDNVSRLAQYLPKNEPLVVLGSIRQEEEAQILEIIKLVKSANPRAIIGLYPRHMERVCYWQETLQGLGLTYQLRSHLMETLAPGTVLLGDTFGELSQAYACARAVFVGGSLVKLGGQNFMEPLAAGLVPVIGPYWKNFAWVGQGIIKAGLLQVAADSAQVARALNSALAASLPKAEVKARFSEYIAQNLGGTALVCAKIQEYLNRQ